MDPDEIKYELEALKAEKYHLLKLINHDIRSPFNRIFALMQLIELDDAELSAQQKEFFDAIYLTVLSGLEMVQNLRDMRDIDAGLVKIEMAPTDLSEVLTKSIRTYSRQTELKHISIELAAIEEPLTINGDPYYLQRCIENILSNAIKFTQQNRQITISTAHAGTLTKIEIQDSGPGVKMEEESYLYEKFKKLSSLATGGEGSLGLGLYNTRQFAKLMGGTVHLARNGKLGSCFILDFQSA
ncbi:MAG: HAMP domain-containing sensor histidine kinase [Cyclobacteriaceae bacterium]|nr:HAMP domain-containing sensor histidine kinase [Cyclobacteriaceae bacterium]